MAFSSKAIIAIFLCYMLLDQVLSQDDDKTTKKKSTKSKPTKSPKPQKTGTTKKPKKILDYVSVVRENNKVAYVKDICVARISGGQEVKIGDIPYQVAFRTRETGIKSSIFTTVCGGSVITNKYVITAAHCFLSSGYRAMTVVAGSISSIVVVSGTTAQQQAAMMGIQKEEQWRQIKHCHSHSSFTDRTRYHDLAIVEVKRAFVWNNRVRPVPLANHTVNESTLCVSSGYGNTEGGDQSLRLRMVCIPTMTYSACNKKAPRKLHSRNNQICTSNEKQSDCQGDFGGGLVCQGSLVGIASFAGPCGKSVTVFTYMKGYLNNTGNVKFRDCGAVKLHYNLLVVILFIPLFFT